MNFNCVCFFVLFLCLGVFGGDHRLVDDEIWHHVTKVLSDHEGHKKILLNHPEPAHLVDAYTKVYHDEPHFNDYHQGHDDHHHHHLQDHHQAYNPHHYHHYSPPAYKLHAPVISAFRFGPLPHHHYQHYKK